MLPVDATMKEDVKPMLIPFRNKAKIMPKAPNLKNPQSHITAISFPYFMILSNIFGFDVVSKNLLHDEKISEKLSFEILFKIIEPTIIPSKKNNAIVMIVILLKFVT